ncbi:uncharacterized protein SAPINGB_P003697 [Magnusiomyces paraingens]|uniref:Complex 1 LYR protein domain-containing protein n=1 Tax=Magnusiomyces paraingens TaxID=2606893 RepID=A0A5E8BQS2_9ASCO|nr:uncharacterized protein SAPINGB_P003697 [Saprochaete ingens]VVT53683.1 unnamed protein product [Saprochaete ingens]
MARKLSGLQREVLALYRESIRAIYKKPVEAQPNFREFTRRNFRKYSGMSRKEFGAIEHLIRKGKKMLELYTNPGVRNIVL